MKAVDTIHNQYVHGRRVNQLCRHFAQLIPQNAKVLDVGCGDGLLASLIQQMRPDLELCGIDVLVRPQTKIPVEKFDGDKIPYADASFDAVMFVDVLHHTDDPKILLREAERVAKTCVLLKDHTKEGFLANSTLRFMDWVGNKKYGVALPYNYWQEKLWQETFVELNLKVEYWESDLKLYPLLADSFFGRNLHFIAKLVKFADVTVKDR
jgi:SAM-dependent methyltransferase